MSGNLENEPLCPFCRGTSNEKLFPLPQTFEQTLLVKRCLDCRCVFLFPPPSQDTLDRAYDQGYYGGGEQKFRREVEFFVDIFRSKRVKSVTSVARPPARVLDVGCGSGVFLQKLIQLGFHCTGVELPSEAARRASSIEGLELLTGAFSEDLLGDRMFDVITFWHVFEHLRDPREALTACYKHLNPGGYILIAQPNFESLQSRIFRQNWFHLDPPRHLNFVPSETMKKEFESKGFIIKAHSEFSLEHGPFGILQSLLNRLFEPRDFLYNQLKSQSSTRSRLSVNLLAQLFIAAVASPFCLILSLIESVLERGGVYELTLRSEARDPQKMGTKPHEP